MIEERSIAMADIPIHNETDYVLTEAMTQEILHDAQEHFGDVIRAIRVQSPASESPRSRHRPSRSHEEPEGEMLPASFEDVEADEEDMEPLETSLESLDEGQEEDEEEDVFRLDVPVEEVDEDEEEYLLDQEDEED
jgi:hypothetical protein